MKEERIYVLNFNTVVNEMNISFIGETSIIYCGEDCAVQACMDNDNVQVYITEREGHYTIKHGDTWGRFENIFIAVKAKGLAFLIV
jgi:hypothetical protein